MIFVDPQWWTWLSAEESPAGHGWCLQGDRWVRSDRSLLLLLSRDQLVRSLPGQADSFKKEFHNDKRSFFMKNKGGHSILWHKIVSHLIWVKERDSIGVVTPYCLGSSFPFEPFVEDAVISNNWVLYITIFGIIRCYIGYCTIDSINLTLAAASALVPDFATCE